MPKIPYEALNPYALGHVINHPPPDVSSNVLFVDFNIPFNWFPSNFWKFLPYVQTRHFDGVDHLKTIAVVSTKSINPNEELFANYIEDNRCPLDFSPDWLI